MSVCRTQQKSEHTRGTSSGMERCYRSAISYKNCLARRSSTCIVHIHACKKHATPRLSPASAFRRTVVVKKLPGKSKSRFWIWNQISAMADVPKLLEAASRWQSNFQSPLPLGAKSRLAIITCMDSRVHPERMFDLRIGDAEVLRNAGGRVTLDMIRSLVVSQEILKTTDIFVIHHTDCGGQAAVRQHGMLIQSMVDKLPLPFGLLLRLLDFLKMTGLVLKPIRNLERSIIEDVEKLKANPLVPKSIGIYGFLYSTEDGSLKQITSCLPDRSGKKSQ